MTRKTIVLPTNSLQPFDKGAPGDPPPANVLLTADAGNNQAVLTWSTPVFTGDVEEYRVSYSTSPNVDVSTAPFQIFDGTLNTGTVTGLTNGLTYYFVVRSLSDTGFSAPSNELDTSPTSFNNVLSTEFDGIVETVDCGASATLDFESNDPFTISAWVKVFSTSGNRAIIARRDSSGNFRGYEFIVRDTTNIIQLSLNNSLSNRIVVTGTGSIPVNTWTHVAAVYNGSTIGSEVKFYINGVLDTTQVTESTLTNTITGNRDFYIGSRAGSTLWYAGRLDEVSVWDSELTATDIGVLYNSGEPDNLNNHPKASDLVSWWRMGDGDDNLNIFDNGPSGNDGTLVLMDSSNYKVDTPS